MHSNHQQEDFLEKNILELLMVYFGSIESQTIDRWGVVSHKPSDLITLRDHKHQSSFVYGQKSTGKQ